MKSMMKKQKHKFRAALAELLGELLVTLLCLGIGALILFLFGFDLSSPKLDWDLVVLLGCAVFIAAFVGIYALVQWIKRKNGTRVKSYDKEGK